MKFDPIVMTLINQREAAAKTADWATFRAIDKAIKERGNLLAKQAPKQ